MKGDAIRRVCGGAILLVVVNLAPAVSAIDAGILGRAWQNHPAVAVRFTSESRDVYEYDNREAGEADLQGRFVAISVPVGQAVALEAEVGQEAWDPHSEHGLDYGWGTAWGVGAAAVLPLPAGEWGRAAFPSLFLGWAVRYRRAEPDKDYRRDLQQYFSPEVDEWQISCELVGRLRTASLGLGIRYSQVDLVYSHEGAYGRREGGLEEDHPWGLFLDAELRAGRAFISGEFRFLDANGGTVALGCRF
ncbi:MAG TPA: hypothetical protein EYP62_03630 [Kiritimatiellae bacterium]|nr:hypothetical protein [Kiritimatiellia bacterium]